MKIYLIHTNDGRNIFYSAPALEMDTPKVEHTGVRGWFEKKANEMRASWSENHDGAKGRVKAVWEWLQRATFADEGLLLRLRHAQNVKIHHAPKLSKEHVQEIWLQYLSQRERRHWIWFSLNALITPITVLLAPLPGPNVVGYWFAYRAVRHILAVFGARRARKEPVPVSTHPSRGLDLPVNRGLKALRELLGREHDHEHLHEFLRKCEIDTEELKVEAAAEQPH